MHTAGRDKQKVRKKKNSYRNTVQSFEKNPRVPRARGQWPKSNKLASAPSNWEDENFSYKTRNKAQYKHHEAHQRRTRNDSRQAITHKHNNIMSKMFKTNKVYNLYDDDVSGAFNQVPMKTSIQKRLSSTMNKNGKKATPIAPDKINLDDGGYWLNRQDLRLILRDRFD